MESFSTFKANWVTKKFTVFYYIKLLFEAVF